MGRAFECRRRAKEARWDKMSKVFPRLARSITVAAKEGGPDPEANAKLRLAINNAKAQNMPKDNIELAIKRASGSDAADITEITYDGKGPHGSLFVIECATDNTNRSVTNIRTIFNKNDGQLVQSGSLDFLFNRKAVVEFNADNLDLDEVQLALIDAGLDSLEQEGDIVYLYGDYTAFGSLSAALDGLGIEPQKASLQRIPNSPIELSEEQMQDLEVLIDKLEDDDDVQAVYTNVD
jgi:YebC/PmpR family DNA-binding regulatory protein